MLQLESSFPSCSGDDQDAGICHEGIKVKTIDPKLTKGLHFCALEYASNSIGNPLHIMQNVILLVIRYVEGGLRFFLHPKLEQVVKAVDLSYIEPLLEDFMERVKRNAAALFEHLASLSVGILVPRPLANKLSIIPDRRSRVAVHANLVRAHEK